MVLPAGILKTEQLLGAEYVKIGVGTNAAPAASTDTALTNAVMKNVTNVNYLGNGVFQLITTLEGTDPAMTINEVGLYNTANNLCYRKVIDARVKVAGLAYTITYQIKVQ